MSKGQAPIMDPALFLIAWKGGQRLWTKYYVQFWVWLLR